MDQKEIKRKIRKHFELNENESPKYQNVWMKLKQHVEGNLQHQMLTLETKGSLKSLTLASTLRS